MTKHSSAGQVGCGGRVAQVRRQVRCGSGRFLTVVVNRAGKDTDLGDSSASSTPAPEETLQDTLGTTTGAVAGSSGPSLDGAALKMVSTKCTSCPMPS